MSRILHLAELADWTAAQRTGSYERSTRGLSLADQGYIHASTVAQLPGVASRYYADAGPLVVLVVDIAALEEAGSAVRWEPVEGDLYPHVYGPIPVATVVAELPARFDGDGFVLPDPATLDVADRPVSG